MMRARFHFYKNKSATKKTPNNSEWISHIRTQWEIMRTDKKYLIIFFMMLMGCSLIYTVSHRTHITNELISLQNKRSETILRQLSEIDAILHNVASDPANTK